MERTLVLLKPDAVQRRLVGQVIERLDRKGLRMAALRMLQISRPLAEAMYAEHEGKDFHDPLVNFVTASPVVAMVLEGFDAIRMVRSLIGPTFGPDAPPGTIRGDFGASRRYNLVHASDGPEAAKREISLFFREEDLLEYNLIDEDWIYASIDRQEKDA
jgi:nucleoside-diphosphate kinase